MKAFVLLICMSSVLFGQVTIDQSNWPYGSDQIGNYWDYYNTSSNVAVNMGTINPLQQGGAWDFAAGPTSATASSEIRSVAAAPQPAPAQTTFTEYQTQGGSSQWLYEDETTAGTFARGVSQNGSVYSYDAPHWNVYHYPMTYGTTWSSSWTWGEEALGVPIQETRDCEIVGWGTVTVPFGGPMQCLVMRTLQTSYAEFLGIPVLDQTYRSYEWLVPGIGSVVAILSVDGETSWQFNTASGYFRLNDTNLGGDLQAPLISGVTDLPDSPNPGPHTVTATITDASGIESALINYSINGGGYASAGPTNVNGNIYTFQIPMLTGSPIQEVRYYVWARDNSLNQNSATNPVNAPTTYFAFSWIDDNLPPAFSGVTVWPSPTTFNGPFPVQATITDDNGVLFASLHYRFGASAWNEVPAEGNVGNVYSFEIPAITATTIVRYYLEAVDNSGFFNTGFHPAAGQSGPIVFQAVFTIPVAPRAVDDLTIIPVGNDIVLNWSPVTLDINGNPDVIDHYDIYRGTVGDGSDLTLYSSTPISEFADTGVLVGEPIHQYVVIAVSE